VGMVDNVSTSVEGMFVRGMFPPESIVDSFAVGGLSSGTVDCRLPL